MRFLKGLSGRLVFLTCIPLVGFFLTIMVVFEGTTKLDFTINSLINKRLPITKLLGDLRAFENRVSRLSIQQHGAVSKEDIIKYRHDLNVAILEMDKTLAALNSIGLVPKNKENLEALIKIWLPLK